MPQLVRLLQEGHTAKLRLRGYSMRPFLEDGRDHALLTRAEAGKVRVGDAVLAEIHPGVWALHRVVGIEGGEVTLMGDGNLVAEHCRMEDVKAVAVAFYRKGRQQPDRTDGLKWRTYSWLWMRLRPVRRYLLGIHRRIYRL